VAPPVAVAPSVAPYVARPVIMPLPEPEKQVSPSPIIITAPETKEPSWKTTTFIVIFAVIAIVFVLLVIYVISTRSNSQMGGKFKKLKLKFK
jgi:hypothetical protein